MSLVTQGFMGGLGAVGRATTSAVSTVAAAPVTAARRAMSGVLGRPASVAAPGLMERGVNYGARHVMSGTLPGAIALGMVGKTPITRHVSDGVQMVGAGREQISAAREGHGIGDPNALSEVQMRRMGLKQAAAAVINNGVATPPVMLQHGEVLDAVRAGGGAELDKHAFMAEAIGGTLAATAIGAGAGLMRDLYRGHKADKTFEQLRGYNTKQDRANFEIIKMYSPMLAMNPTVLESELRRMRQMDLVPHELVDSYTSMQGNRDKQDLGEAGFRSGLNVVAPTVSGGLAAERARIDKERAQAAQQRAALAGPMPAGAGSASPGASRGGNVGQRNTGGVSASPGSVGLASSAGAVRSAGNTPAARGGVSPAAPARASSGRPDARKRDDDKKAELEAKEAALTSVGQGIGLTEIRRLNEEQGKRIQDLKTQIDNSGAGAKGLMAGVGLMTAAGTAYHLMQQRKKQEDKKAEQVFEPEAPLAPVEVPAELRGLADDLNNLDALFGR